MLDIEAETSYYILRGSWRPLIKTQDASDSQHCLNVRALFNGK